MARAMGKERRRYELWSVSLELQIVGVERRAVLRHGDISMTGLFVELDHEVGEPGTVHTLKMRSRDKAVCVRTRARVARVTRSDDLLEGARVTGVGFELLAYTAEERAALDHFLAHVGVRPEAPAAGDGAARGVEMGVHKMTIQTDWQLRKGERIGIELPSEVGGSVRLEGRAVRSRRSKSGDFRTTVEVLGEAEIPASERAVQGIRELLVPRAPAPHLAGDLSRFRAPTLLTLAELERATGELRMMHAGSTVTVYLAEGRVLDAEGLLGETVKEQLATACRWERGRFELRLCEVRRADRVGMGATALLLELARLEDEAARAA